MVECPECGSEKLEHTTNIPNNGGFKCENKHTFSACPKCGSQKIQCQRGIVGSRKSFYICVCGHKYFVGQIGHPW